MAKTAYSFEKSVTKSVKYPVFAAIATFVLQALEVSIVGLGIQFPEEVEQITKNPQLFIGLGLVIFVYDLLKHRFGVRMP